MYDENYEYFFYNNHDFYVLFVYFSLIYVFVVSHHRDPLCVFRT